jgi:hypothetical protein
VGLQKKRNTIMFTTRSISWISLPGLILAGMRRSWSKPPSALCEGCAVFGMTGAQAAERMLRANGGV